MLKDIKLPEVFSEHSYSLLTALLLQGQIAVSAFRIHRCREKVFPKQFMAKIAGDAHRNDFGQEIHAGGWPDSGEGLFGVKLSYKDWYELNQLQRIHELLLLHLPIQAVSIMMASLVTGGALGPIVGLMHVLGNAASGQGHLRHGKSADYLRFAGKILRKGAYAIGVGALLYAIYKSKAK